MKYKTLPLLFIIINTASAQSDLIFKDGFEEIIPVAPLNDTGITWAGEYPSGNNGDCTSVTITPPQDCHQGRDFTHNDDGDGHAGFSFTKLDASGTPLADQSVDYTTTPWSCVKDNVTGLVWEVKNELANDVHHKDNTYQRGGLTAIGREHPDRQGIYYDPSWNELVQGSINETFCGFDNWRVPTVTELLSIVNKGTFDPAIDINYFPNIVSIGYWSSSPLAPFSSHSRFVDYNLGFGNVSNRNSLFRVRLVRWDE